MSAPPEGELARFESEWTRIVEERLPPLVELQLRVLRSESPAAERNASRIASAAAIDRMWADSLQSLTLMIEGVKELTRRFALRLSAADGNEDLYWQHAARTFLSARGVETAIAIDSLLRSGLTSAALALWRTLHELAASARVINTHGETVARAYLEHGVVQSCKTLRRYRDHSSRVRSDPVFQELLAVQEKQVAELRSESRYGPGFNGAYGWARAARIKASDPTFEDVERKAGLAAYRPAYHRASLVVHPGVRGLMDHLYEDGTGRPLWERHAFLAEEPLELTAKSLGILTRAMVDEYSPISDMALVRSIDILCLELLRAAGLEEPDSSAVNEDT